MARPPRLSLMQYVGWYMNRNPKLRRYVARTGQLPIVIALVVVWLYRVQMPTTVLIASTLFGIVLLVCLELFYVKRRGEGPTFWQYPAALLWGRSKMGYTSVPFSKWKSIVDMAAKNYQPSPTRALERVNGGRCTWFEYVYYFAYRQTGQHGLDASHWWYVKGKADSR